MYYLNLIMVRHSTNLHWGTFHKITGLDSSKLLFYWRQWKIGELFQRKDDKGTWGKKAMRDLRSPRTRKGLPQTTGKMWVRSVESTIVSMLISWFWSLSCGCVTEWPCFWEMHTKYVPTRICMEGRGKEGEGKLYMKEPMMASVEP